MMVGDSMKVRAIALATLIGLMWLVRFLDALAPGYGSVAGIGIVPRSWQGLDGILVAPLIHESFEHLIANSIPLIVLGCLVLFRGTAELLFVVLVSVLVGGLGTWIFGAADTQHIGASGLVFGFFGYLVFRTAFDHRLSSALITLIVAAVYGASMAYGLIPNARISWSGHFFGFLGGVLAARWRYPAWRRSVL
jgi:membrane associated rhomboid family serine protease